MALPRAVLILAAAAFPLQGTRDLPSEPDANAQKEKLRTVRELFKDDYAKRALADQQALARKLLKSGLETQDDPPARFVLLREARDLAAGSGDVETALEAAAALARSFAVDGVAMKMGALAKAAPLARDPAAVRSVAQGYLSVVQDAVRADDYEAAAQAAARAEAGAKGAQDAALAIRAAELRRDVGVLRDEYQKVKSLLEKPGSGDSDPAGRFLCFVKDDWERGLPLLGQAFKSLAEKDLAKPSEADKQIEVADGWWDAAQKEKSPWKRARILARAEHWYQQAVAVAAGLPKVKVERRLEELEALRPGFVNLLKLIDVKKDAVNGVWKTEDGKLVSDAAPCCRIEVPYRPPSEYDVRVTFSRVGGSSDVNVILTRGGKSFVCVMGGGNISFGLGDCKGVWTNSAANPSVVSIADAFAPGRTYSALIEVRRDRVKLTVEEKAVFEYKTDYSDLSINVGWKLRDDTLLGIGSFQSSVAFHKLSLIEVNGTGKRSR